MGLDSEHEKKKKKKFKIQIHLLPNTDLENHMEGGGGGYNLSRN